MITNTVVWKIGGEAWPAPSVAFDEVIIEDEYAD